AELVEDAKAFLAGKSTSVQAKLGAEMEAAAAALDFERAAALRDRIRGLREMELALGVGETTERARPPAGAAANPDRPGGRRGRRRP
ncbi:MAG TPA: UvrB/UvrC motif-containing protein, partial [Candidatus Methanoperedens sp.]|nr:UvrB/UvrC motif-containing protein [Candidatus Methanoperedens sp.]